MNIKAENIIKHVERNGRVILKMDAASGIYQMVITKRTNDYVVGEHPNGILRRATLADVRAILTANSVYIESYR
ncbi:hypothetical protein [Hafnia phage Pocis76]|uniref:Uncharacterized protein n=1 Tax=Hafnia phage Pocis76 TaxID=2831174 RepID=A0A8E7FNA1_9CAUD|nr:hypothetical protein [Hafnia phage Pocis76]